MNLANGRAVPWEIDRILEALDPDVVALQELVPAQATVLERRFSYGKLDPATDSTGMGMVLRHPATLWRLPMAHRDAYVAELVRPNRTGGDIEILNVHIAAPHLTPLWRTLASRRRQLRALETHLDASRRPRAVVGDLNSTMVWPVYRRLCARLTDAALEVARHKGGRPTRTWGPAPGAPKLLRIDHALTEGLTVLGVEVHPIAGSDHSALLLEVV